MSPCKNRAAIEITLSKKTVVQQTVEVQTDSQSALTESASSESQLSVENATSSPRRPNTLVDALPLNLALYERPMAAFRSPARDEEHSSLLVIRSM